MEKLASVPRQYFFLLALYGIGSLIGLSRHALAENELEIKEVLVAQEFVLLSPIDPLPDDVIQWEKNSGKFLYIARGRFPFVYLMGTLAPGYEISLNNKWVPLKAGNRFEQKVNIPLEPGIIQLRVFAPDRSFETYRFNNIWQKIPPSLHVKMKEGDKIYEKFAGFTGKLSHQGFSQLYMKDALCSLVDLDSIEEAGVTFRLFLPPAPEPFYDAWSFLIFDDQQKVISETKRLGSPPSYLEWREVGAPVQKPGSYTYSLNLFKGGEIFEGAANRFDALEGVALVKHSYTPAFRFEPRQEMGYFRFSDNTGYTTNNFYVGADLGFVFWDRLLLRGTGLTTLHTLDPESFFTMTRLGAGFRFFGTGENPLLGMPHFYHIDVLINLAGFTLYNSAPVQRYTQGSLLIEPHIVLWKYHYFVPSFEFGMRPRLDQMRLAMGLGYYYFIRPWSLKLGFGFNWDNLIKSDGNEGGQFRLLRGYANFIFML